MEKVTHVPIAREALIDKYPDVFGEHHIRVIAPVNSPTAWVSSMVTVPKTNRKLRICLDPRDLNRAVQRAHYPSQHIEDIATRLHVSKVFTKIDARNGFWHVALDDESSYLTTFYTPSGSYHWRRLPLGTSSARKSSS